MGDTAKATRRKPRRSPECVVCGKAISSPEPRRCCSPACVYAARHKPRGTPTERLLRLAANTDEPEACWLWHGSKNSQGYGKFQYSAVRKGNSMAHRVSHLLFIGPIPEGQLVLHRCDSPSCVNPAHLFLGTQKDNMADCKSKGRFVVLRGESHGASKLKRADVAAIRRLYAGGGQRYKDLAERFGVSVSQIRNIINGNQWKETES